MQKKAKNSKIELKIAKRRLPTSKMTGEEKNYVAAVLEDVRHDFKAFGEVLQSIKEKMDATLNLLKV